MERPRSSSVAWGVLGTGVIAYDCLAPDGEMLSERLDDALERPLGRAFLYGAVGAVALHLCNLIPEKYDPIHRVSQLKDKQT